MLKIQLESRVHRYKSAAQKFYKKDKKLTVGRKARNKVLRRWPQASQLIRAPP